LNHLTVPMTRSDIFCLLKSKTTKRVENCGAVRLFGRSTKSGSKAML
jgi:hypothetical protein